MRLKITTRLTLTAALLTALFFAGAAFFLERSIAAAIRADRARAADAEARNLAAAILYEWDEDLMVEFARGPDPLATLTAFPGDWALVRGGGSLVRASGVFAQMTRPPPPGRSRLIEAAGRTYRVGSSPLFPHPPQSFEALPAPVREAALRAAPNGRFLRARREYLRYRSDPTRGEPGLDIEVLEGGRIRELVFTLDGRLVATDEEPLVERLPPDLLRTLRRDARMIGAELGGWTVRDGQLLAIVRGRTPGGLRTLAVNRLGERFRLPEESGVPILDPSSRLWVVYAGDAGEEIAARRRFALLLAGGAFVLWAAVVSIIASVTRRALSPVGRIVEAARDIEASRLSERLPLRGSGDELDSIAVTVNRMLDRIEEAYEREKRFTADASHELRGPLAKVIADLDVTLSQERTPEEYRSLLRRVRDYARSLERLVESLLWLSRLESGREGLTLRSFDLTDLAVNVTLSFDPQEAARVRLVLEGEDGAVLARGDPDLIRVLLKNLVENALRYSPCDKPVDLRITRRNGKARVEVRDYGRGLPPNEIQRLFSRFYRVDKSRSRATGGFGLGLAIANEIARAHDSSLRIENAVGGGLLARFELPLAEGT